MTNGHGQKRHRKWEAAIAALLAESTIEAAATKVDICEKTLRLWLADPDFQRQYRQARRQIVDGAIVQLQQATRQAVETLRYNPTGKPRWGRSPLLKILRNRKYTGDWVWGMVAVGKYHRYGNGGVRQKTRTERRLTRNAEADWVIVPDHHEPLVDRNLFERVQGRLSGNRHEKGKSPGSYGTSYVLSRLLVWGHCGAFMIGLSRRAGATGASRRQYVCGGYVVYGKPHCNQNTIHEQPILNFLIRKLQDAFLDPDNLDKLRADVAALEKDLRSEENLGKLRRQVQVLDQKIDKGSERLLELPRDVLARAVDKLRAWEKERDELRRELHRIETESPVKNLEQEIVDATSVLWQLQDALRAEDNALLREVLRQLVSRVELRWTHQQTAKKTWSRLAGGVIYLRPQEQITSYTARRSPKGCRAVAEDKRRSSGRSVCPRGRVRSRWARRTRGQCRRLGRATPGRRVLS
jgi:hypothetical protein